MSLSLMARFFDGRSRPTDGDLQDSVMPRRVCRDNISLHARSAKMQVRQKYLQAPAEGSQPAIEASSGAASKCFMLMYFLLLHRVPATWRSLAQTGIRAELPSGNMGHPWRSVLLIDLAGRQAAKEVASLVLDNSSHDHHQRYTVSKCHNISRGSHLPYF